MGICGQCARGQQAVCGRSGSEIHYEAMRRGWKSSLKINNEQSVTLLRVSRSVDVVVGISHPWAVSKKNEHSVLSGHRPAPSAREPSNHSLNDSPFGESQAYHKTQVSEGRGVREKTRQYSHSPVFETPWSMRQSRFLSPNLVRFPPLLFYCIHTLRK